MVSADTLELEEGESEMESNMRRKICYIQLVMDRTAHVLPTLTYHKEGMEGEQKEGEAGTSKEVVRWEGEGVVEMVMGCLWEAGGPSLILD